MKILFTIPHMTIGGAQKVCYTLLQWLQNNADVDVLLIIYSKLQIGDVKYDLSGIRHIYCASTGIKKIQEIRHLAKKEQPDVFVSFGVPNAIYDVPAIWGTGIKHVICERNDPANFKGSRKTKAISRLLMKKADGFVFQTLDAQKYYGGSIAKKSAVIFNPIQSVPENFQQRYDGIREQAIVTAGRLNKQKNFPMLISAFAKVAQDYPDHKLIIYGEGPERTPLERQIVGLGLESRILLPGTTNNVLQEIYKKSIFVLSSDFEGMPNALMEAMTVGLPCISTDCPCGGPKELIRNMENGILIPVNGEGELVAAIKMFLDDNEMAQMLGRNAMAIKQKLSVDRICQQWYDYLNLISQNNL